MTREEKISHLKGILSEINENDNAVCYLTSEDNELIKSAIEALEQEPCEDAISREEAIDAVADLFEMSEYLHPYSQGKPIRLKDIKEKLKQLPSVQPKPIECEDAISRDDALMCMTGEYLVDKEYKPEDIISKHIRRLRALPSVQPKPIECSDVISREQAIDALHMCLSTNSYDDDVTGDSYICYEEAEYEIGKLPPVQPKIKTGHWIVHPKGIYAHLVCDKCLSNAPYDCRTNYCPNCGAKMQEVEDGNK